MGLALLEDTDLASEQQIAAEELICLVLWPFGPSPLGELDLERRVRGGVL